MADKGIRRNLVYQQIIVMDLLIDFQELKSDKSDYVFAEAVAKSDLELCNTCGGGESDKRHCPTCNGFWAGSKEGIG